MRRSLSYLFIFTILLAAGCTPAAPEVPLLSSATATTEQVDPSQTPLASATANSPPPSPTVTAQTLPTESPQPTSSPTMPPTPTPQAMPDANQYTWTLIASGLDRPVGMADLGDGTGSMLVVEQAGLIRVIQNGTLRAEPFLDIRDRVGSQGNEQGLLGLALHPHFSENGYFYVNYTDRIGDTVIARFSVSPANPGAADPQSERQLLWVKQPYGNHNGGGLVFGPDGTLYLGLGDGGSAGDPHGNGQRTDTYLGKILHLDVDGGEPYAVPEDNPFAPGGHSPNQGLAEIWAYGLRNPWRFSFDRLTGELYIADVGQNAWEEVNFLPAGAPAGANFGWSYREGAHDFEGIPPANVMLTDPVAEYDHSQGCSVTGGYVYRGASLTDWQGIYLYGDYCSGIIWGMWRDASGGWNARRAFETGFNISSFGEDASGELYVIDLQGGLYRLDRRP